MSDYTAAQQDAKLAQARALLAKAESTSFPAEAETLSAKAAELIAQYGLDAAKVYAADNSTDELTVKQIDLRGAYLRQQFTLLSSIGGPLRVQVTRTGTGKYALYQVWGFRSDVERVELLFTSLLLQVRNAMAKATVPVFENAKTFRTSFFQAFSQRVYSRLRQIERQAQDNEAAETGSNSTALVLVDRKAQVDRFIADSIGKVRRAPRTTSRSLAGHLAGREAADTADLGQTRMGQRRAAIGS